VPKNAIPAGIRRLVEERASGCCEYCLSQQAFATHRFSIDHVIPPHFGGSNELENLALACQGCNNYKYTHLWAQDPLTETYQRLYHPRIDLWAEHFQWNENFSVIIGITPIGRATVHALRLNRDSLIKQRIIYRFYGVHPPK
jgi:HNH endonuclease